MRLFLAGKHIRGRHSLRLRHGNAAKDASDLRHSFFPQQGLHDGGGAPIFFFFYDQKMLVGKRRDLRRVRDGNDLRPPGRFL